MHEQRVRIGNQTAPSATRPREPFEYALENGFDAFEWFLDMYGMGYGWEEADLNEEAREKLRQTAAKHDIRLSVHAPWWLDPFDPKGFEQLIKSMEFAMDIGAANLNIHPSFEYGIDAFVRTVSPLLHRLIDLPLQLSIENIPSAGPEDFNALFSRLGESKFEIKGIVGMCLDLGHANLFPPTCNDYLGFIDRIGTHVPIVHLHVHENYGDDDSHLPLFLGPSKKDPSGIEGFVERMKRRGFSGCLIFEVWPDPPSLLNRARNRLIGMFDSDPTHLREGRAF